MRLILLLVALISFHIVGFCSPLDDNGGYTRYSNAQFGSSVEIPKEFVDHFLSANNDGRRFVSPDGRADIRVSFILNNMGYTPSKLREEVARQTKGEISFTHEEDSWIALSWVQDGRINYQKSFVNAQVISTILIAYPIEQREKYDAIVQHMEETFVPAKFVENIALNKVEMTQALEGTYNIDFQVTGRELEILNNVYGNEIRIVNGSLNGWKLHIDGIEKISDNEYILNCTYLLRGKGTPPPMVEAKLIIKLSDDKIVRVIEHKSFAATRWPMGEWQTDMMLYRQ